MTPVYQKIVDKSKGDCMRATFASLLDIPLYDFPNLIEYKNWFEVMCKSLIEFGYEYDGTIYNKISQALWHPKGGCFVKQKWHRPSIITPKCLYKHKGFNGYFYAAVYSPKYFKWTDNCTHAIIIDRDFNIVHDPQTEYKNILKYPFADIIGYNGVIDVSLINPIS